MSGFPSFTGFPKECLDFLMALSNNNNREWFQSHKGDYQNYLLKPAQEFVTALGERLKTISVGISYDDRTNGSGSIMRIHRDLRFSKDKTPYHTYLRMIFWEGKQKKNENPSFFISIEPGGAGVFVGQYQFSGPVSRAYRQAVAKEDSGAELEKVIHLVNSLDHYQVGGSHYKRVPSGYDPGHKRAALLKHNGLFASISSIDPGLIQTPEFIDLCFKHCQNMAPIQRWLVALSDQA